jgi:hypothetical protein
VGVLLKKKKRCYVARSVVLPRPFNYIILPQPHMFLLTKGNPCPTQTALQAPPPSAISPLPLKQPTAAGKNSQRLAAFNPRAALGKLALSLRAIRAKTKHTKDLPIEVTAKDPTEGRATRRLAGLQRAASASAKAVRTAFKKAVPSCGRHNLPAAADAEVVV